MTGWHKTQHYDSEQWVDFVRGVVSGLDKRAMQAHLDHGCEKCREMSGFFARVAAAAAADAQYHIADAVLQQLFAIFTGGRPLRGHSQRQPRLHRGRKAA